MVRDAPRLVNALIKMYYEYRDKDTICFSWTDNSPREFALAPSEITTPLKDEFGLHTDVKRKSVSEEQKNAEKVRLY